MVAASSSSAVPETVGVRNRSAVRTAVVWEQLREVLAAFGRPLDVLDVGGGSGGFAVPLAQLGHRLTVVDPSPDSLAALERRAAELGATGQVRAVQGDAAGVVELVGADSFDAVLCHSVLEVVDDPAEAMRALAATVRADGVASVLAANRVAAVAARASAGRLGEARHLLDDDDGRATGSDPLARRFDIDRLVAVITAAGLRPRTVHGVRVFIDSVPAALLDTEPSALDDLLALERAVAERPDFLPLATAFHVVADRS